METNPRHPRFVRWALMLGIVIILNVFFSAFVALALPAPEYSAYCPAAKSPAPSPQNAQSCDAAGGIWTDYGAPQPAIDKTAPTGYCDLYATCQPLYQAASDKHDLYAFIFMVVLGVLALLAGFVSIGSSIVSSGLSYGGVVALIVGSVSYWGSAGHWVRFGIATLGLLALLYVGWKRFRD